MKKYHFPRNKFISLIYNISRSNKYCETDKNEAEKEKHSKRDE